MAKFGRGSQAPGTAGGMVPPRGCPHAVRGACEPRPSSGQASQIECRRLAVAFVPHRCVSWRSFPVANPTRPGRRGAFRRACNTRPASWAAKCGAPAPFAVIVPVAGCRCCCLWPRLTARAQRAGRLNVARHRPSLSRSLVPVPAFSAIPVPRSPFPFSQPSPTCSQAREMFHGVNVSRISAK